MPPWSRRLRALSLIIGALLCTSLALAGPQRVYPAPSPQWASHLQTPLAGFVGQTNTPLAVIAGLPADLQKQALSPVIYELSRSLHLKPADFAKLSPADQGTALALAAEEAKQEIMQRSYKLVGESQGLVWSAATLDHDSLGEMYRVASGLKEVRTYYSAFLGADERDAVEMAAVQSSARYLEAREAFVKALGLETAASLQNGTRKPLAESSGSFPAVKKHPNYSFTPSKNALRLLEEFRRNRSGWGQKDLEALYTAFEFTYREGSHRVYYHPVYKDLGSEAVSRQNDLPPGYAHSAVKLIDAFLAVQMPQPVAGLAEGTLTVDLSADLPAMPKLPESKIEPVVKKPERLVLPESALSPTVTKTDVAAAEIAQDKTVAVVATPEPVKDKVFEPVPPVVAPAPVSAAPAKKKSGFFDWLRNRGNR